MENKCYLGIDLTDEFAMISYYQLNMREPETVSLVAGSEAYQIPLFLAKRKKEDVWYYGNEAVQMAQTEDVILLDSLLQRAMQEESMLIEEEIYEATELLAIYLKKIIKLPTFLENSSSCDCLILTVEKLTKENMIVFRKIASKLGLSKEQFTVIDHKESFYYYTLNQPEGLWRYDVYLFEAKNDTIHFYALHRNIRTIPQVITIEESVPIVLEEPKDEVFLEILKKAFEQKRVSCSYLIGDGFDGNWLRESVAFLCRGRRAFAGNNLFSKGACYAAYIRNHQKPWNFVYIGENDMKFNLSLKVKNVGKEEFFTLISAGKNYFEMQAICEVILAGSMAIDFWKQLPHSREAVIETLELTDLPNRPDRTTRLRIMATPIADDKIEVEIKDLGFGDICKSSKKVWKYTMEM